MEKSRQERDADGVVVPLMELSVPQTITVNGSAGAAVLSGVLSGDFIRLTPTVDMFVLFTTTGTVTAATGHFLASYQVYDLPRGTNTKVSLLAVGTSAGTCYLSELV